ncbi:hypothetical protein [Streptomyces sp. NPDC015242]|uniref:hypothetical protein n=1 Tax=Streptomyces sp. NPDC015242 TaxID=3364951 RepID=UPI003700C6CD
MPASARAEAVALYAQVSVDAIPAAYPEVDFELLRTVEKGRRTSLAAVQPIPV